MEASMAHRALTIQDIEETTTPRITKEIMETSMRTGPSIKEETCNTTPRMHPVAGTTVQSQWT